MALYRSISMDMAFGSTSNITIPIPKVCMRGNVTRVQRFLQGHYIIMFDPARLTAFDRALRTINAFDYGTSGHFTVEVELEYEHEDYQSLQCSHS
jgi:hypothetical protein